MISKVLKAQSESKATAKASGRSGAVYDNKGSATRLVNYMEHEADAARLPGKDVPGKDVPGKDVPGKANEQGETGMYFSSDRDGIAKQEVINRIDSNVKGLKKEDSKFYSLILSPSSAELAHIGSDADKLKAYTRQAMENYAANFNLPDGQRLGLNKLKSKDLVWYGIIHRQREYSGTDIDVKQGRAKSGQLKQGDQTHIHIIVSRRDSGQKISLTPTGSRDRFSIQNWQQINAADFQRLFGYSRQTHFSKDAYKEEKLRGRMEAFKQKHQLGNYLSTDRIALMGKEQGFGKMFYRNLKTLENTLEKGIRPTDPYSGLDRRNLYKQYRIQRNYQIDNKSERALNRQVVTIRAEYLKAHGVALTELDMSTEKIKRAYAEHAHQWKFYQNLDQLKDTILKTGQLPADYQERLERKATSEEIQSNKEKYRASRKQSVRESANEHRQAEGEKNNQAQEVSQKISQDKAFDKSDNGKLEDSKGFDPCEDSGGPGGSTILAGLSMLQNFLSGMSAESSGGKDVEWGVRPTKKHKIKEQQNNQEYGL
jgi:hypothetical protein